MLRIYSSFLCLLIILAGCDAKPSPGWARTIKPVTVNAELVKRLNQVNKILDGSLFDFLLVQRSPVSTSNEIRDCVAGGTEVKFLIENPDLSLPLMFERFDPEKLSSYALCVYFLVFQKTASAESLPYIIDYLVSVDEGIVNPDGGRLYDAVEWAVSAANSITACRLTDDDISDEQRKQRVHLKQWYEQWYKKYERNRDKAKPSPAKLKPRLIKSVKVNAELIKRLNRVNEILEDNDVGKCMNTPRGGIASDIGLLGIIVAGETEVRFLIENPDISLPLMFERLDHKKVSNTDFLLFCVYFIVFGKTRSAESIPYICDYITLADEKVDKQKEALKGSMIDPVGYALSAAREITSLKIDHMLETPKESAELAARLRQWYEDYKKTHPTTGMQK